MIIELSKTCLVVGQLARVFDAAVFQTHLLQGLLGTQLVCPIYHQGYYQKEIPTKIGIPMKTHRVSLSHYDPGKCPTIRSVVVINEEVNQ